MAAAGPAESKTVFQKDLDELELTVLKPVFEEHGWDTHADFAFCTPSPSGNNKQEFEELLAKILKADGSQKRLIPKMRRLYQKSYITVTTVLQEQATGNPTERVAMNAVDRSARIDKLRTSMAGLTFEGHTMPSNQLIDKFCTMLVRGTVQYIKWESCTSRTHELTAEPEVKGLRLQGDKLLVDSDGPQLTMEVTGELIWEMAMRRRAAAGDIGGLVSFAAQEQWHQELSRKLLQPAPNGYKKISWAQLRAADVALWSWCAHKCERGTKAPTDGAKTAFETAWMSGMQAPEVLQILCPLPATSTSASSSSQPAQSNQVKDLQNRIKQLEQSNKRQKQHGGYQQPYVAQQQLAISDKGNGKGRKGKKGKDREPARPKAFGNLPSKMPDGTRLCFGFNLPSGCPLGNPGGQCPKGKHVCAACYGAHPLGDPSCPGAGH